MPARVKEAIHSQIQPTPSEQVQLYIVLTLQCLMFAVKIVKLRRGSGKDQQGMAVKGKGLKA